MKTIQLNLYAFIAISLISLLFSCSNSETDDNDIAQTLELNANIKTFPVIIILSDKLNGSAFPQDLQRFADLSASKCKTLPVAGILRLGRMYYTYNCISDLKITGLTKKDEGTLTNVVDQQVKEFLSSAKLEEYDSLLTPNDAEWNIPTLALSYINNTSDTIFFYTNSPASPAVVQLGTKQYPVFRNAAALRSEIDKLVCTSARSVSVFYNYNVPNSTENVPSATAPDVPVTTTTPDVPVTAPENKFAAKGTPAGDTCIGTSRFEKLHNGSGGFTAGNLIERNSTACGFKYPTGVAGDTCISGSRYQKLHNGQGGFTAGNLIERNSKACGFRYPTGIAGDTCISGSRYQKLHNGRGGFAAGALIERNSKACGFRYPTGIAGDTCISGSRYQKLHNGRGGFAAGALIERNSKACGFRYPTGIAGDTCISGSKYQRLHNGRGGFMRGRLIQANSTDCGFTFPARGTAVSGFICYQGSKYAKLHDGKGGFMRGALVESNSTACQAAVVPERAPAQPKTDNQCVRRSEPMCEQDANGHYTGRSVQLCYNSSGRVIRTIVIKKCDAECRCIGN